MLSRAQSLLSLYAEMGVPKDKLIMRVPATWAGIQAAAALEKQGIATQAFHIYRYAVLCRSCWKPLGLVALRRARLLCSDAVHYDGCVAVV
jgi:hypothetical protein